VRLPSLDRTRARGAAPEHSDLTSGMCTLPAPPPKCRCGARPRNSTAWQRQSGPRPPCSRTPRPGHDASAARWTADRIAWLALLDELHLTDLVNSIEGLSAAGAAVIRGETGELAEIGSVRRPCRLGLRCPRFTPWPWRGSCLAAVPPPGRPARGCRTGGRFQPAARAPTSSTGRAAAWSQVPAAPGPRWRRGRRRRRCRCRPPVRAGNRIHGSDQQSCLPGAPPVMIT
jgi:hypothetical protein